jgi:hypothetical protein
MKTGSRKIELKCLALAFIVSLAPSLVHAQTKPFQIMVMDAGFNDVELKTLRPDLYKALNAPALLSPVVSDVTDPAPNQNLLQSNLIAHETDKGNHFIKVIALVMAPRSGKDIPSIEIVPTVEPIQHLILQARTRGPTTVDQLLILMMDYFLTLNKIAQRENVRIVVRSVSNTPALLQTLCQSARVIVNQWPKCSSALESVYRQGFAKFFASNPMTAFVQAAGNDFARLGPLKDINWQDYSASNVLVVAALAKNQSSLESYSNWHPSLVRVAAPGDTVDPSSSRTVTGTSYSGPRAAVYVRDAMMNDERLSGSEAIKFVLDHDAQTTPSLVGKVFGGKVLAEDFPALTGDQKAPVHPKVSRLKKLKAWLTRTRRSIAR